VTGLTGGPTANLPLRYQRAWAHSFDRMEDGEAVREHWSRTLGRPLCGTTYCIAGHAVAMTEGIVWDGIHGEPASGDNWDVAGARALGLDGQVAAELFEGSNTRADIQRIAERIAADAGERL
jgi:hypothetical protein